MRETYLDIDVGRRQVDDDGSFDLLLANVVAGDTCLNINEEEALDWTKFRESYFADDIDELDEINETVYNCLKDHVEAESLDIVESAGKGQGLEAWRRLNRRWDPMATGSSDQLWKSIQNLGIARVEDLMGAIERLRSSIRDLPRLWMRFHTWSLHSVAIGSQRRLSLRHASRPCPSPALLTISKLSAST